MKNLRLSNPDQDFKHAPPKHEASVETL